MKTRSTLAICTLALAGCASMFMHGGDLVGAGYQAQPIVTFRAEGTVPDGVTYSIVRTLDGGQGIFERSADGSGTVITNRWRDAQGDHFFGWVGSSHGYEYVFPADRSQPGVKIVYPAGYYSVSTDAQGVERPVPSMPMQPVAMLYPVQ
jgi:hypothetical protein